MSLLRCLSASLRVGFLEGFGSCNLLISFCVGSFTSFDAQFTITIANRATRRDKEIFFILGSSG